MVNIFVFNTVAVKKKESQFQRKTGKTAAQYMYNLEKAHAVSLYSKRFA